MISVLFALTLASCGASPPPAVATAPDPAPLAVEEPPAPVSDPAPAEPSTPPPPAVAVDHRAASCFPDDAISWFETRRWTEGAIEIVQRASMRPGREGAVPVPPGSTLRIEVALENVGTSSLTLRDDAIAVLERPRLGRDVLPSSWASAVPAGATWAPHAVLRLCVSLDVGRAPLFVGTGRTRTLAPLWAGVSIEHGHGLSLAGPGVETRYPQPGRSLREPESWGGVVRLRLAPGASLLTVARETGVAIGSRAPLARSRDAPVDVEAGTELVEVPADRRVADVVAVLRARPDVLAADGLWRGDAGTEGCSENSPCPRGLVCANPCGIEGCPHACMTRRAARIPRP